MTLRLKDEAALARLTTTPPPPRRTRKKKQTSLTPGPREAEVLRDVLAYLQEAGVRAWRSNAGGARVAGKLVRLAPAGTADVLGVLPPRGRLLAVELKRPGGGQLSAAQSKWLAEMEALGALCVVARSCRDVYQALREAGHAMPPPRPTLL